MTAFPRTRRLVDPHDATTRSTIAFPPPLDVDLAPQLLVVALAQAALAATHRALDSAHPSLSVASRHITKPPSVSDSEDFAILVLLTSNELAGLLSDYAHAVIQENIDTEDTNPF